MKHIKKYVLPVLCIVAGLLSLLGCEEINDAVNSIASDPTVSFAESAYPLDIGGQCLRVFGEAECGFNTAVPADAVVGTVTATDSNDATIVYSLSGTDATSFSVSDSGVITVASALSNLSSTTVYNLTLTATVDDDNAATTTVVITNNGTTNDVDGDMSYGNASDGNGTAISAVTDDGASGSSNSLNINRTSGGWGGLWFEDVANLDLTNYTSLNYSYKAASGNGIGIMIKMSNGSYNTADPPVFVETACDNEIVTLTKDGVWQQGSIALADFIGADGTGFGCDGKTMVITDIGQTGFWTTAAGEILIDEIYFK